MLGRTPSHHAFFHVASAGNLLPPYCICDAQHRKSKQVVRILQTAPPPHVTLSICYVFIHLSNVLANGKKGICGPTFPPLRRLPSCGLWVCVSATAGFPLCGCSKRTRHAALKPLELQTCRTVRFRFADDRSHLRPSAATVPHLSSACLYLTPRILVRKRASLTVRLEL